MSDRPSRRGRRPAPALLLLAAAPLAALLVVPVAALLVRALAPEALATLTLPVALDAIRLSLLTSGLALALTVAFGTPLAYLLARVRFPGRGLLDALVDLPVVLPPVVAGVALLLVFGRRGWLGAPLAEAGVDLAFTTTAVVLAQAFVASPFYVRALKVAFAAVPRELEGAARTDGATRLAAFVRITAPLAAPGFVEGALLAWARALGEFGATIVFAGSIAGRTRTLPLAIYATLERDLDAAVALAGLLTAVALAIFLLVRAVGRASTPRRR
ncbi:MAG: ABC transporter permease [Trueperaceae bacterium]|nr:ABC transporter permease [Trueperaceae bacterium]